MASHRPAAALACWLALLCPACSGTGVPRSLDAGRMGRVAVFPPRGEPRAFVYLISGTNGWDQALDETAARIAESGAAVVGVTLREGVVIGAGAAVLGNIVLGRNVKVGAGSVVVTSAPDNATVVGIPARIVGTDLKLHADILDHADLIDPIMSKINALQAELRTAEEMIRDRRQQRGGVESGAAEGPSNDQGEPRG